MKVSMILLSALTLFPALVACGGDDDDDGGSANVRAYCEKGCVQAESLGCDNAPADCVADCEDEAAEGKATLPNCGAQIDALGTCYSELPASQWECDAGSSE